MEYNRGNYFTGSKFNKTLFCVRTTLAIVCMSLAGQCFISVIRNILAL